MQQPESKAKPIAVGVRLSELAAILDALPRLSPEEAEAFGADIDEARRQMQALEISSEPPPWPIDE